MIFRPNPKEPRPVNIRRILLLRQPGPAVEETSMMTQFSGWCFSSNRISRIFRRGRFAIPVAFFFVNWQSMAAQDPVNVTTYHYDRDRLRPLLRAVLLAAIFTLLGRSFLFAPAHARGDHRGRQRHHSRSAKTDASQDLDLVSYVNTFIGTDDGAPDYGLGNAA